MINGESAGLPERLICSTGEGLYDTLAGLRRPTGGGANKT